MNFAWKPNHEIWNTGLVEMLNSSLEFINSEVILILPVARGKGEPVRKPPAPSHGPDTPEPEPESQFRGVLGTKHTQTSGHRSYQIFRIFRLQKHKGLGERKEKRILSTVKWRLQHENYQKSSIGLWVFKRYFYMFNIWIKSLV